MPSVWRISILYNVAIPDDAKPESFKVGNDATFLQIVSHHTTARAAIQKYSLEFEEEKSHLRLVLMYGATFRPISTAFLAKRPAPSITLDKTSSVNIWWNHQPRKSPWI